MSNLLTVNGKASADVGALIEAFRKDEQVDDVVVILRGTLRKVSDEKTASRGKDQVAHLSMNTALLATEEEYADLLSRLDEVRAEEARTKVEANGQGNVVDSIDDEYSGLTRLQAVAMCKARGINARGSRLELIQRLRDNG